MASLAIGVRRGALLTLWGRRRSSLTVIEVNGFGVALSFGVVHLLTIAAVVMHASPPVVMSVLATVSLVVGSLVMWKGTGSSVAVDVDDAVVIVAVMAIGVPLYLQGSPFDAYEDQVLVSIVRRLSVLELPR